MGQSRSAGSGPGRLAQGLPSPPLPFLPSGAVLVLGKVLTVSLEAATELATQR